MNKYARTAILAAKYVQIGNSPGQAWKKASCEVFAPGSASQKKGCPKNAFIGLYGESDSVNGQYAQRGLAYLRNTVLKILPHAGYGKLLQITVEKHTTAKWIL